MVGEYRGGRELGGVSSSSQVRLPRFGFNEGVCSTGANLSASRNSQIATSASCIGVSGISSCVSGISSCEVDGQHRKLVF